MYILNSYVYMNLFVQQIIEEKTFKSYCAKIKRIQLCDYDIDMYED